MDKKVNQGRHIRTVQSRLIKSMAFGAIMLASSLSFAAELRITDKDGSPYLVMDAVSGATFRVEAQADISGSKSLNDMKLALSSAKGKNTLTTSVESNGLGVFEGVEAGYYVLTTSDDSMSISKVDGVSSTQAGMSSDATIEDTEKSAALTDNSTIRKSAYAVGAAAVAGLTAVGVAEADSGVFSSSSSGSSSNSARTIGALRSGSGSGTTMIEVRSHNPSPIFFDDSRPAAPAPTPVPPVPTPKPAPAPFSSSTGSSASNQENPANDPAGQATPAPAPDVVSPMTPS